MIKMYICLLPCIFFGNRDAFVFSTFCHSVFKKIIVGDRKMFWNLFLGKEVKLNNKQKKKRKRKKKNVNNCEKKCFKHSCRFFEGQTFVWPI